MPILDGIRVIDLTQGQLGPEACMILADLGADVIKIEPRQGEYTRAVTRDYDTDGINAYFLAHNRNKRGIALDYTTERGREIIYKLVETADIFVTTYAPGAVERHGFGYDVLSKINPRLIYCRGSAFGPEGPMRDWHGNDIVTQGWSGLAYQTGDGRSPVGTAVIDECAAVNLALGAVSALWAREKTGKGQLVNVSLLQTSLFLMAMEYVTYMLSGKEPRQSGRGHSMVKGLYSSFPTKDGSLILGGVANEPWPEMCQVLGLEQYLNDPRFSSADSRGEHLPELIPILDKAFARKTTDEWMPLLWKIGLRAAPVLSISDALVHPLLREQIKANKYLVEMEAGGRQVTVPGPVIEFSDTPAEIKRPGFAAGEHTHEILLELGYTWEDIGRMISEEAI